MLQAKQAGQSFAVPETAEPGNVVDIMEALKRSLQAGRRPPAARAQQEGRRGARRRRPNRRASPRRARPRRARRRAEAGGGIASRRSPPWAPPWADPLPRRPPAGPDAPAPRPAGARPWRQARAAAGRARDDDRLRPFGRGPGARRRPRAASARPAGDGGADQRERAAPRSSACSSRQPRSSAAWDGPRSNASPAWRPISSPA